MLEIQTKGFVNAEELKNQLGDRLPGAVPMAAAAMGMDRQAFLKAMKNNQVISAEFIPKYIDYLFNTVKEGVPQSLQTERTQRLKFIQEWDRFLSIIFNSGLGKFLASVFSTLTSLMKVLEPFMALFVGVLSGFLTTIIEPIKIGLGLLGKLFDQLFTPEVLNAMSKVGYVLGSIIGLILPGLFTAIGKLLSFFSGPLLFLIKIIGAGLGKFADMISGILRWFGVSVESSTLAGAGSRIVSSATRNNVADVAAKTTKSLYRVGAGAQAVQAVPYVIDMTPETKRHFSADWIDSIGDMLGGD